MHGSMDNFFHGWIEKHGWMVGKMKRIDGWQVGCIDRT